MKSLVGNDKNLVDAVLNRQPMEFFKCWSDMVIFSTSQDNSSSRILYSL